MTMRTHTSLFDNHSQALDAVRELEVAGFSSSEVSLLGRSADETGSTSVTGAPDADGAAKGATMGTVVGGGAGLLAGIGALAIPGVGPIVAAGWLVALITGAGVGAAAGGLLGSLVDSGVDEKEAPIYAEGVRRGGTIVTIRTEEARLPQAQAIIMRHMPVNISSREAEYRAGGWTGYDESAPTTGLGQPDGTPGNPRGTMASRAVDDVAGTNISGARPENETRRS
ncbi:MAG: hypothetical protein V4653_09010 [Pseudomonadota bacterium]